MTAPSVHVYLFHSLILNDFLLIETPTLPYDYEIIYILFILLLLLFYYYYDKNPELRYSNAVRDIILCCQVLAVMPIPRT